VLNFRVIFDAIDPKRSVKPAVDQGEGLKRVHQVIKLPTGGRPRNDAALVLIEVVDTF
jgi:hypothetical protein